MSVRMVRRAARSGKEDGEHGQPRARLLSGSRRPSPCASCDGPSALPRAAGEPRGGASKASALSPKSWAGCSHAP